MYNKYRVLCMFIACLGGGVIVTNMADVSASIQQDDQLSQQAKQRLIKVLTEVETRANDNTNRYNQWYRSLSTMLNIMIVRCIKNGVDAVAANELDALSDVLDTIMATEKHDVVVIKGFLEAILESVTHLDREDLKIIQISAEHALFKAIPDENLGLFFMRLGKRRPISSLPLPAGVPANVQQKFVKVVEFLDNSGTSAERYSGWFFSLFHIFGMMAEIVSDNAAALTPGEINIFADMIEEMHTVLTTERYERVAIEKCLEIIRGAAVSLNGKKLNMKNVIDMVYFGLERIPEEKLGVFLISLNKMSTSAMELLKK